MAPKDTAPAAEPKARLSVARNPKATYDYFVLDTMEAGVVLTGTEVKSLRRRGASIKEAFARKIFPCRGQFGATVDGLADKAIV